MISPVCVHVGPNIHVHVAVTPQVHVHVHVLLHVHVGTARSAYFLGTGSPIPS